MELDKYIVHSGKVRTDDLDWDLAGRIGLTDDEVMILTYFADIEGQTIFYLRELLATPAAMDPDVMGFTTVWNYEEYFHARALSGMLEVCGHSLGQERNSDVRASATIRATLEAWFQTALARVFRPQFPALYFAWGASQELLTLRGYEQLARTTANPVLSTLCERIAKQERRHYAWYFNSAKEALQKSRVARALTRFAFRFWTPVGEGVKSAEQSHALARALFPNNLDEVAEAYDRKLTTLPGLDGMDILRRFASEVQRSAPALRGVAA